MKSLRYQVGREIAKGGMATVFEGRHAITGRRVALKSVARSGAPSVVARLFREAQILGELRHPSIVDVLDFEESEETVVLVTTLLEGRPLDGLITSRGRLGVEATIALVAQLAGALAHAHDRGIVHRDIKPANVLIVREGAADRAKLIDFGIAGHVAWRAEPKLTTHGEMLGTLAYSAPEQIGKAEAVDTRSDQYALGALAFEALTGAPPPLPERLKAAPALPGLPMSGPAKALSDVVTRLLQPRPEDRFTSMREAGATLPPAGPLDILDTRPSGGVSAARRHTRAPFLAPVRVVHGSAAFDGRSENISASGLLVLLPGEGARLAVSDTVAVRFPTPVSGRRVSAPAVVRWVRGTEDRCAVGLELQQLPPELPAELDSYLKFFGAEA